MLLVSCIEQISSEPFSREVSLCRDLASCSLWFAWCAQLFNFSNHYYTVEPLNKLGALLFKTSHYVFVEKLPFVQRLKVH